MKAPDDRILTSGFYDFRGGGGVTISLRYRDKDGKRLDQDWNGSWRIVDPTHVEVSAGDSHKEVFERSGDTLVRTSTTIGRRVWESKVVLKKQP